MIISRSAMVLMSLLENGSVSSSVGYFQDEHGMGWVLLNQRCLSAKFREPSVKFPALGKEFYDKVRVHMC